MAHVTDQEMVDAMNALTVVVKTLHHYYDLDPTLNNRFNVSDLTPMSIDEWHHELIGWCHEEQKFIDDKK